MKLLSKNLLSIAAFALCGTVLAGTDNDVPSCYAANKLQANAPATTTELFVLVDQTTPLDATLQASVRDNVGRLITPGHAYTIASFSSFGQGQYLQVLSAGTLEQPLPGSQRDSIGARVLQSFDACMKGQADFGRRTAAAALHKALSGLNPDFAKSDVMGSIKAISARVRSSQANHNIVFLVSDMLEHSGISSFYASKNVRRLDVATELKKAEAAQMFGDLAGARVFVLGAGLVQSSSAAGTQDSGVYRDPQTMNALRQFWTQYVERSQGKLEQFGAPALLVPVQ